MSDFLGRLARRSIDAPSSSLRPRLPSLFEPTLPGGPDPAPAHAEWAAHSEREADGPHAFEASPPERAGRVNESHERTADARVEIPGARPARNTDTRPDAPPVNATSAETAFARHQADATALEDSGPARVAGPLVGEAARERRTAEGAESSIESRVAQLASAVARVESRAADENVSDANESAPRVGMEGGLAPPGGASPPRAHDGERGAGEDRREGDGRNNVAGGRRVVTPAVVVRERAAPSREGNAGAGAFSPSDAGPPIVRVTIGRVEVRAVTTPAPRAAPEDRTRKAQGAPALSLEDYLKRRDGGAR